MIHVLPHEVIEKIAAGEVVERPVSVVKELVENAIDAKATRIFVELGEGGQHLISVTDDGVGIPSSEVALAMTRHATSKITQAEDLYAIRSFGFRGEALPSIAAVSRFEMETRPRSQEAGTRIIVEGGITTSNEEVGAPPGTRIVIKDLFFNIPARRKFLKSPSSDTALVSSLVNRFALIHPSIHFRLTSNDRRTAEYPPCDTMADRLAAVIGASVARRMHPIEWSSGVKVNGFISEPSLTAGSRRGIHLFVNGRTITDPTIVAAILAGYGAMMEKGKYPKAVLFIEVDPADIDVNVHPAKTEVRFARSHEVFEAVAGAVRATLRSTPWIPGRGPQATYPPPRSTHHGSQETAPLPIRTAPSGLTWLQPPATSSHDDDDTTTSDRAPTLAMDDEVGYFGSLRVVGIIKRCYIICESDTGLVVIDQHAAHERVTFERLKAQHEQRAITTQGLLFPKIVELTPEEMDVLGANTKAIGALGLGVEIFGPTTIKCTEVPNLLEGADPAAMLRELLHELGESGTTRALAELAEEMLSTMACHASIRAGDEITIPEARALLADLDRVDFNATCPHGRPLVVSFDMGEIAGWFARS